MSPLQNKVIHSLLAKTGLTSYKSDMIYSITKGRTSHSREMNFEEAAEFITYLNSKNKLIKKNKSVVTINEHCVENKSYNNFLDSKRHIQINYGIEPNFIPEAMFDYQKHVSEYAIRKGRCAVFLDTGLGKTIIELVVAKNYIQDTNKPVLIIAPLSVAFQFIKEAEKFGIDDISYSKDGKYKTKIVVCNYERLEHFNSIEFDCVLLDESSILKNFDGAIKQRVTDFLRKVKYRFLFTATPSPNDFIELGTSSETLGYLGHTDMLTKFFKNNGNSIDIRHAGCKWYLKPHAGKDFWRWVASWSISMRKPSDLGYSDALHILPELNEVETIIRNENPMVINGQRSLFALPAQNFFEIKAEVRSTINQRCEMAVSKCLQHNISFCWVNLNDEGDLIESLLPNSVQVSGNDDLEKKEEAIQWFVGDKCICNSKYFGLNWRNKQSQKLCGNHNTQYGGEESINMNCISCTCGHMSGIRRMISKTKIFGFGLNMQHCNHTTYFPTYSYEQYYQAIRRFWRFGQKRSVFVDLILSDGQTRIMESLMIKKDKAFSMFENLAKQTNSDFKIERKGFDKEIKLPNFIK